MMRWLLVLLSVSSVFALQPHNLLIQKLEAIRTMKASFQQTVFLNGRQKSQSQGTFSLQRPRMMRWNIEKPQPQLLVADGQSLWIYEPRLQQVTKRPQSHGVGGAAGLFLSAAPNVWVQGYKVTMYQSNQHIEFRLHAKNGHKGLQDVIVRFVGSNLKAIEFNDQFDQHSVISLQNVETNGTVASGQFKFKPPKDTDVIVLEK